MVAVTRERRYGPSRLRVNDDGQYTVYHARSVRLSRAKATTRFDDRYAKEKVSKSGVWDEVPEGIKYPSFETQFPYCAV